MKNLIIIFYLLSFYSYAQEPFNMREHYTPRELSKEEFVNSVEVQGIKAIFELSTGLDATDGIYSFSEYGHSVAYSCQKGMLYILFVKRIKKFAIYYMSDMGNGYFLDPPKALGNMGYIPYKHMEPDFEFIYNYKYLFRPYLLP